MGLFTPVSVIGISLLLIGTALLILEMWIPGFGLPGISGIILIGLGIWLQAKTLEEALLLLLLMVAVLGVALFIMLIIAKKGNLEKNPLVLSASIRPDRDMSYFVGKEGTVITPLRPAGTADFDGVRLDVVAEASFVPAGTAVKVIKAEGNRIVVRSV